jgi:uncharacterized protein YfaP (DUF2135 family)
MRRIVWFMLLLVTGGVLAEAQEQIEALPGQTKEVQEKTEAAQLEGTQKQVEAVQGQTEDAQTQSQKDAKVVSGMSILGNQEAPKSLVIVPWKRSEIGNSMDISTILNDSRQPVDKEVFMRALHYYEIRSETKR